MFHVPSSTCSWFYLFLVLRIPGSTYSWFYLFLVLLVSGSICPWFYLFLVLLVSGSTCSWFYLFLVLIVTGSTCSWFYLFLVLHVPCSTCFMLQVLIWSLFHIIFCLWYFILFFLYYLFFSLFNVHPASLLLSFLDRRIYSLKYLRSTTLGCKDIRIRKSEFVAKTQYISNIYALHMFQHNTEYKSAEMCNLCI